MQDRATTLAEVANRAGVHAATVSRVLSRPELVRRETRERVRHAVEELGYRPNRAARELAGGSTGMVALVVPDITNPYFGSVVQAAQRSLQDQGQIAAVADSGLSATEERRLVSSLAPNVDGLILFSPIGGSRPLLEARGRRPMVVVNRQVQGLSSVTVDQNGIVERAVEHLHRLGHRDIASLGGPKGYWSSTRRRRAESRLTLPVQHMGSFHATFEGGQQAARPVARSRATAAVAFNDAQALGLMAGLDQLGIDVPEQISVVGSDDIPFSAMANPALTTVAAPLTQLGETAVALLLDGSRQNVNLPVDLVIRKSTGAPP